MNLRYYLLASLLNNTFKMATQTRFAEISFEEIEEIKDKEILQNSKHATKCDVKLFKGKQFSNLFESNFYSDIN